MKADFFIISAPNAPTDNLSKVNFEAQYLRLLFGQTESACQIG